MSAQQDRPPNFRGEDGRLYLVRCFACSDSPRGVENWAIAVADGVCAWCGWSEASALANPQELPTNEKTKRVDELIDWKDFS